MKSRYTTGNRWKVEDRSNMATNKQLRAKLEHDKAQVLERLELLKADSDSAGDTREGSPFGKREEEATEAFELEKRMAMERSLGASLAEINRALAKFDSGEYGKCETCGGAIEPDRLEARPQASLCMRCMALQPKSTSGVS
jgi:DnaK suppressor protein